MTLDQIVEALRIERELRGWSFKDVNKAGGPSASMVWYYERGEKKPSVDRLIAWAAALDYQLIVDLEVAACKAQTGIAKPRVCALPRGHGGDWHDDGSACWPVEAYLGSPPGVDGG